MGFVDDDGEGAFSLLVVDLLQDEGEFLHRRDDDLLAVLDELAQVARAFGVPHRRPHLGVLLDGVVNLPVEQNPVGHHDDRVEDVLVVLFQPD